MEQVTPTIFQNLQAVWETNPLIFAPDTLLSVALSKMYPIEANCYLYIVSPSNLPQFNYAVAIDNFTVIGTFDEQTLLRQIVTQADWSQLTVKDVISLPEIIEQSSYKSRDFWQILAILNRIFPSPLVLIDRAEKLAGTIDLELLVKALPSLNFLQSYFLEEIMEDNVVCAAADTRAFALAELMVQNNANYVLIIERVNELLLPLGIVRARDILQLQVLGVNLAIITAYSLMNTQLSLFNGDISLLSALPTLQQKHSGLIVIGEQGELRGIILPQNILQVFQPDVLLANLETVYQTAERCNREKQLPVRQTQLLAEITRKISTSLELKDIVQTTVDEVRQLLNCDRVTIVQFQPNNTAISIGESVAEGFPQMLGYELADPLLMDWDGYRQGKILVIADVARAEISQAIKQLLQQFAIQAKLVVPILSPQLLRRHEGNYDELPINQDRLQGLLIVHQCSYPRQWQGSEIDMLQQLADRLGLAIAQVQLLDNLEGRVRERTRELTIANIQLQQEIEEHQQTEIALRENQQKLAGILDCADEAIISIDERQIVQLFNQSAEQMFGYSAEGVLGKPLDKLLPSVFSKNHRQHIIDFGHSPQQTRSMSERSNRVYGRRSDGSVFPAEASISKMRSREGLIFTVMLKDITERQQAEASLRRSEAQLRSIANALPILIAYIDNRRRYRFNNRAHELWFGKTSAEIDNCHLRDIVGVAAYRQIFPYVRTVLLGQTVTFELELIHHDGTLRWVSACYIPDFDERDRVKGFFATFDDISKRKALERMQSEFVSIASHEMRTPLTSIHGVLKLLAANRLGELTPKGREMTQIALRNTDRTIRLINDVLDLERMESGRETIVKQVCNSAELIRQAADTVEEMARNEEITLEIDVVAIKLWVDPDLILQTLTNLLSNSTKFSPPHSTITIRVREHNNLALFSVIDQGRGIPSDKLDVIFERFQQVDASDSRKKGGTGLGLSICRYIINKHGGQIWAESTLGQGSTFYFTLPKR
jgi:PAS domain S-box-containing protein